jgi:hypothetical protein
MTLINFDGFAVRAGFTHAEFALLKSLLEHEAERNHDTAFNFPSLLAGFRETTESIKFAHSEGLLDDKTSLYVLD